jgi:PAS domain S-box-containing protein
MSANTKIVFIVVIGVGACLLSIFSSQYFHNKDRNNKLVLSHIDKVAVRIEHIRVLGISFIQDADQTSWGQISQTMESVRQNLQATPHLDVRWRQEIEGLNLSLENYNGILTQLYEPAVNLKAQKKALQQIGLAFSREVEEKIIKPYRKEEGLRIFDGKSIDPFKARAKDAAYDLVALHIKQQLLLLELLMSSDLGAYNQKKHHLSTALTQHKAQIRYMAVLMGRDPSIQSVFKSLDQKLKKLLNHEHAIIELFTALAELDDRLRTAGDKLLAAGSQLSSKITSDTLRTSRLNRIFNWSLLLGILVGLSILGALLARNIIQFVEDLKTAKQIIEESEEKYRLLANNLPGIVCKGYKDWSVEFFDEKIEPITGYDADEFNSNRMKWIDIIVEEDIKNARESFIQALKADKSYVREYRIRSKTGDIFWIQERGHIVCDSKGEIEYVSGVFFDVTDRHQFEKTKTKLQDQLQQAQKMESLGTLAGGIAHDFNNLLMGIQGRTSLMLLRSDSSHSHFEHLKGIEDYIQSAAGLTKQLLGFARGGKYEIQTTDLNEFIKKQNLMFGRTRKEINIHERFEKKLWTVEVDQGQIEQVLLNLYVNSWQAMPGGGELYIQTENIVIDEFFNRPYHVEPGKYVKIIVTDTGAGMDEATQQRIFDPFFTTKEMGRGTGLGLASAYGIIKNHDGFIDVYSEKGEGTTFNIYFPASGQEAVKEKEIGEKLIRGTETVLLVDDENIIIDVSKDILKTLGYKVLLARGGEEALIVYKKNQDKIDMVILDMIMPDMGGGETYDKLKEINPDIKVLLSSGYSINGQANEILERGCDGFIQKPYKTGELSKKIWEVLRKE